jgi:glycine cleavage system H protein
MTVPGDLKYTKDHEWVRAEAGVYVVGITAFAQEELGEIVFCELPEVGQEIQAGETLCVVESTKAASDVYAPITGKVVAVNSALEDKPGLINGDPYSEGWMVKLESAEAGYDDLMDSASYAKHIGS